MTIKKIILLLLVMLGSVTGAWADTYEARFYGYTTTVNELDGYSQLAEWSKLRQNDYVKVELSDQGLDFAVDDIASDHDGYYVEIEIKKINSAKIRVTSLDTRYVTLNSVTIGSNTYPISGTSWSNSATNFKTVVVDYTINHTHSPAAEWSYNDNQHWHVCQGTGAKCPSSSILDRANHVYHEDLTNAASAYTCSVCGYVNTTKKAEYESRDYLSLKAVGGNVTIGMVKTGTPADYDLQYSFDRTNWTSIALTATNPTIVDIVSGQTCYFRHGTVTAVNGISTNENYWTFTMTGTGTIEAGGNIMSLLDITVKKTNLGSFAFANLFKGCNKLTKAPKLPATSISERCYMGMFEGAGIAEAPALIANKVENGAYQNMFRNCLNLETAPELVATQVNEAGYMDMFNGCKKIKEITLGDIATIEDGNAFLRWLDGTAYGAAGIIIAPDAMVANASIPLPSNWMYKQIRDYTTAVSNALEGTAEMIQNIGQNYIQQIKQAASNASAQSLLNEALGDISLLKKYNSQIEAGMLLPPTEPGMRLKVTTKDGKVYEFQTSELESTEYYRAE